MIRRRSHHACTSLPGSSLLSSLPLRSHQKAPLRGLAPLILTSQTHATHPHTHTPPAPSPFHSTTQPTTITPFPLSSPPAPGGMGHLGGGGPGRTQERDPGEVVRWRIRCSLPTASVPLPLSNLLIHTQRCLAHIASGNGYSQTVAFCPRMDPLPISPSPPPTSGWLGATPAAGRGAGMDVCGGGAGSELDLVLTYDKLVSRAMTAAHRTTTPLPDLKSSGKEDVPVAR